MKITINWCKFLEFWGMVVGILMVLFIVACWLDVIIRHGGSYAEWNIINLFNELMKAI